MKKLELRLLLSITLLFGVGCTKSDIEKLDLPQISCAKLDTLHFTHSMKGWELYSFSVSSSWKYSLLVGTNALKTYDQVSNNQISVIGQDSLKVMLSKLPANEELVWIGANWLGTTWQSGFIGNLALPPRSIQIDIKEFCDNHNIKLTIVE